MKLHVAVYVVAVALLLAAVSTTADIDPEAPTAGVSWCTGPWSLGCEGDTHRTATIPVGATLRDAIVVEDSGVGWKWFSYIDGPPGCLFVGTNGRDFPGPDRKAGFFVQGFAPIMGIAGRACAGWGITTDCGLLPCY